MKRILFILVLLSSYGYSQQLINQDVEYNNRWSASRILNVPYTGTIPSSGFNPGSLRFYPTPGKLAYWNTTWQYLLSEANASILYTPITRTLQINGTTQSFANNMVFTIPTADLSNYYTKSQSDGLYKPIGYQPGWDNITGKPSFATVATSGSYTDLTNKPTIPAQFNPIAGTNVALSGTYPNITINASGGSGGAIDAVPTSGSANAVSSNGTFNSLAGKQATLVSGTNLKTVNGITLLGAGDLTTPQGSVTSFAKTDGFGIVSSVSNPTTTPNHSISVDTTVIQRVSSIWTRQGPVIDNAQEASVIVEGSPQVLTTASTVFKMWYTIGFGSTPTIGYAESLDGISFTPYSGTLSLSGAHSKVIKNGSTYYIYITTNGGTNISRYSSSNGISWTLNSASVLPLGSAGDWDSTNFGNTDVFVEGGTWHLTYEAKGDEFSLGGATSTDGLTWTKTGQILSNFYLGGANIHKIGSTYYLWCHSTKLPSLVKRFKSTDLLAWVQDPPNPTFTRVTKDEGVGLPFAQVCDVELIEYAGKVYQYYTANPNGSATYSGGVRIKVATANMPFTSLINTTEDNPTMDAFGAIFVNGINVGIAKSPAESPLDIKTFGTGYTSGIKLESSGSTNTIAGLGQSEKGSGFLGLITTNVGETIRLDAKSSQNSFINNGGSLGIGTSSPLQSLHVENNAEYQVKFGTGSGSRPYWQIGRDNLITGDFHLTNETALRLGISPTGNTYIGYATDQGYKLAVNGNGHFAGNMDLMSVQSNTVGAGAYLQLGNSQTGSSLRQQLLQLGANGDLINFSYNGTSYRENVRILNSNGYLGIGTTSPVEALDVNGKARVSIAPTNPTDVVRLQDLSALGNGTVISVSTTGNNGISGTVTNPTTTPSIALTADTTTLRTVANSLTKAQLQTLFNTKANVFTVTTTGTGAATYTGNVLNIPTPDLTGFVTTDNTAQTIIGQKTFNSAILANGVTSTGTMAVKDVTNTFTGIDASTRTVSSVITGTVTVSVKDNTGGTQGGVNLQAVPSISGTYTQQHQAANGIVALLSNVATQANYTASGNGSSTTISITHGLTGITTGSSVIVQPRNAASSNIMYATADATTFIIVYSVAPVSGSSNLSYSISVKP